MRRLSTVGLAIACLTGYLPGAAQAADPVPPFIPANADWLTSLNYFRAMSHLPPVSEDASKSVGAANHSCYMLDNGIAHDEIPGRPRYTTSGDAAGNASNVAVSSNISATSRSFMELWMTGPFHAIGMLRPQLRTVGYGECRLSSTLTTWHSAATLDIITGLPARPPLAAPILFPGNGTVTNLYKFITESPNPVTMCGWPSNTAAGLPVVALMPETYSGTPTASIVGPTGPLQTCVLGKNNASDSTARGILEYDDGVVVVPRTQLVAGTYTVTVRTSARTVTWSFTVDPAAADVISPATAVPSGSPSGWTAMTPQRFVDSRIDLGATRLLAGSTKRVKLAGRLGLPASAVAITANFTAVTPDGPGYLTVWNCASPMPTVSTLNFVAGDIVANGASVPLDSSGYLCLYSPVGSDFVVDINGYYSPTSSAKYVPMTPLRVVDSREGLGISARLRRDSTAELVLPDVPSGAAGVALNITAVNPSLAGYVTVYPCGDRPSTSTVNFFPGQVRPNMTLTPISARGSVCFFSLVDVDLVVDVMGYLVPSESTMFTPSVPFRWTDTRYRWSTELNGGTGGSPVGGGQVIRLQIAGRRGVPSDAAAVSINITAVDGAMGGFLTVYPCGTRPPTSNVNHLAGAAVANGAVISLSTSGELCLYSLVPVHAIIDVNGWWE